MLLTLQVLSVFLVGVAMSLGLAHALEFPGKMRLDQRTYMAVQAIYYPGFTIGGAAEPLAIIGTGILGLVMRNDGAAFWWTLASLIAVAAMHVVFWTVTQPTNRYWLKETAVESPPELDFSRWIRRTPRTERPPTLIGQRCETDGSTRI